MQKFLTLLILLITIRSFAQKHDYVWIIGDDNEPNFTLLGGSTLDFNYTPLKTYYNYRKLNMATSNASICDSLGRLVAYSNGCDIAGPDDQILINGEDINLGEVHTKHCDTRDDGYIGGFQSALMLPKPNSGDTYFFFYEHVVYVKDANGNVIDLLIDELRYAIIKTYEGARSEVIQKDAPLIKDTLSYGPAVIATKHANGRDWWILTFRRNSNEFYIIKFTSEGIKEVFTQTIGIKTRPFGESLGQLAFSPDGSKLYRTNTFDPVLVYDFDRETGRFTGFDTISYDYGSTPVGEIGCAVSPNGRFLYLAARMNLWQLDLQAPDISASQTLVCEWVQQYVSTVPTVFTQLQLGPDCKIYGLGGGDTKYYHVIHNPDNKGMDCNAELNGLILPTHSGGSIPSFPNFRLGPLGAPGLPCSPVVSTSGPVATPLPLLSVFPNPARERLTVTVNQTGTGPLRWRLRDALGRLLKEVSVDPSVTDWAGINLDGVPSGACFWEATAVETGKIVGSGVVLVQD